MSYTRNSLQSSKHTQTESERIEKKTFYANINAKKPEVATLVSDKIDLKKKKKRLQRKTKKAIPMVKRSIQEEDVNL